MGRIKRAFTASCVAAVLAAPFAAAAPAAAVGDVDDLFYQTYSSVALCRSIASDLRQSHYTVTTDCVRLHSGGNYVLRAYKISIG